MMQNGQPPLSCEQHNGYAAASERHDQCAMKHSRRDTKNTYARVVPKVSTNLDYLNVVTSSTAWKLAPSYTRGAVPA